MNRQTGGRLLRGGGRILLAIGAAGAVLAALAMLATLLFARDYLGTAFNVFVWSGTVLCVAAAAHYTGRHIGGEQ